MKIFDKGFTLIEIVVVMGIFLAASTIATSIFLSANTASRRTVGLIRAGSDARWGMEKMVEDIRLGSIDYAGATFPLPASTLRLRTTDGETLIYDLRHDATVCGVDSIGCIAMSRDNGTTVTNMTQKGIDVRRLDFYVWPEKDPFLVVNDGRERGQPRVTIVLTTQTTGQKKEATAHLTLQTTVSTRVYKR